LIRLLGPEPLELTDVLGATRRAVERWLGGAALPEQPEDRLRSPGLYLAVRAAEPELVGVWICFGPTWMDRGHAAPSGLPPYADAVLTALTEAVWWSRLRVWPIDSTGPARRWTPLVVLEWPPPLAARAELPLPGEPVPERARAPEDAPGWDRGDEEAWLDLDRGEAPVVAEVVEEAPAPGGASTGLPPLRSALTVVRGELEAGAGVHKGRYALVDPPLGEGPVPLGDWLGSALAPPGPAAAGAPRLGPPVELPGAGVGFPLRGWLDRRLQLRPPAGVDVVAGALHDRDVHGLWRARLRSAGVVSASVLLGVLAVAVLVWKASEPDVQYDAPPPPDRRQPALSLCSAANERFMEELRCQIAALAVVGDPTAPVCRDAQSPGPTAFLDLQLERRPLFDLGPAEPLALADLQPVWCGLRDRAADGWREPQTQAGWTELAAAKACHNMLDAPEAYRLPGEVELPNVTAYFDERRLRIAPLVELVGRLDAVCDELGRRSQRQIEGAVLATHVGDATRPPSPSDAGALRAAVADAAAGALVGAERRCLREGVDEGFELAFRYDALCGGPEATPPIADGLWPQLGPQEPRPGPTPLLPAGPPVQPRRRGPAPDARLPVIDRYVALRFGTFDRPRGALVQALSTAPPTWRCHLALSPREPELPLLSASGAERAPATARLAPWDLTMAVPRAYELGGAAALHSQIEFDAAIGWLRGRGDAGVCWRVVQDRVADYVPVHPLLPGWGEAGWPSPEQQLCGQVCASWFRVARPPRADAWVTPNNDLAICVEPRSPEAAPAGDGAAFDQLRLPWNERRDGGWSTPTPAEVCGFNLVAQGWFAQAPAPLLPEGLDPARWAGEEIPGSQIAGGRRDAAALAAGALDSYGGERSAATCASVAVQCLVSQALDTMREFPDRPFTWAPGYAQRVALLSQGDAGGGPAARRGGEPLPTPWCRLVKPYLPREGAQADGRLDYPCAVAVEQVHAATLELVEQLAAGRGPGAQP
jgi:hypothetical protein